MLIILIAYMAVVLAVGLYASRRVKGSEDFHLAGRSMGLFVLVGTLCATQLGGGNIIGTSTNGYNQGLSGMTFGVSTGLAMLVLGLLMAKPMRKMGLCTISDFVYNRYQSNTARVLTSVFSFAALVGILAAQVGAISKVLTVFGINTTVAAVIAICVIILYTAFSGMWGVALTDVIQLIVIFIGVPLTTFIGLIKIGGWSGLVEKLSTAYTALTAEVTELKTLIDTSFALEDTQKCAEAFHDQVLAKMEDIRTVASDIEALIPDSILSYPTYDQLLFSL